MKQRLCGAAIQWSLGRAAALFPPQIVEASIEGPGVQRAAEKDS